MSFCRQGRHSGSHFTTALPLLLLFSIFQNPAKAQALAALASVAALPSLTCISFDYSNISM
jgi:hypothetical protein